MEVCPANKKKLQTARLVSSKGPEDAVSNLSQNNNGHVVATISTVASWPRALFMWIF